MKRIVESTTWTRQLWKNGGGVTFEVARSEPHPDAKAPPAWRVSVAEVTQPGPFSLFPGVDRVIALLSGAGFTLTRADGHQRTMTEPGEPFAFRGEEVYDCALIDGPVRDLNLMVDRSLYSAEVRVLECPIGAVDFGGPSLSMAFVLEGKLQYEGRPIGEHDLLLAEVPTTLSALTPVRVFHVRLHRTLHST